MHNQNIEVASLEPSIRRGREEVLDLGVADLGLLALLVFSLLPTGSEQGLVHVVVEAELAENYHDIFRPLSGKIPEDSLHRQLSTVITEIGLLGFGNVGETVALMTSRVSVGKGEVLLFRLVHVNRRDEVCLDAEVREPISELLHPSLDQFLSLLLHSVLGIVCSGHCVFAADAFGLYVTDEQ